LEFHLGRRIPFPKVDGLAQVVGGGKEFIGMGDERSKLAEDGVIRGVLDLVDLVWKSVHLELEMGDFADYVGEMVLLTISDETDNGSPVGDDFFKMGRVPGMESRPVVVQVGLIEDDPAVLRGQEAFDPARPPVCLPELHIEFLVQKPSIIAFLEVQ
jgi:hypothetical protein